MRFEQQKYVTKLPNFWRWGPVVASAFLLGAMLLMSWTKPPQQVAPSRLFFPEPLDSLHLGDPFVVAEIPENYVDSGQIIGWHLTIDQLGTIRELEQIISEDTLTENRSQLIAKIEDLPLIPTESTAWEMFLSMSENETAKSEARSQSKKLIEIMHKRDLLKDTLDRNRYEMDRSKDPSQKSKLSTLISTQRSDLATLEKQIDRLIRITEQSDQVVDKFNQYTGKGVLKASLDRLLSDNRIVAPRSGFINHESLLAGKMVYVHIYPQDCYIIAQESQDPPETLVDVESNIRIPVQSVENKEGRWLLKFEEKYLPLDITRKWRVENSMQPGNNFLLKDVFFWYGWKS